MTILPFEVISSRFGEIYGVFSTVLLYLSYTKTETGRALLIPFASRTQRVLSKHTGEMQKYGD